MSDFYFSGNIDGERTLCLAPLTERKIGMSGQEIADKSGYFLFEQRGTGEQAAVEIIAQVLDEDAALKLRELLKLG